MANKIARTADLVDAVTGKFVGVIDGNGNEQSLLSWDAVNGPNVAGLVVSAAPIGKTGGRTIGAKLSGMTAALGSVATACSTFANTQVPLACPIWSQGINLTVANQITILTDGIYDIVAAVPYAGGTAGNHTLQLVVNADVNAYAVDFINIGGNVTSKIVAQLPLSAGDVLSLQAYVEPSTVTMVAGATTHGDDLYFSVARVGVVPIQPILSGYSEAFANMSLYGTIVRDITNHWLNTNTWADVSGAGASLATAPDPASWKAAFPSRAITIGCPLIPYGGNAASTWNTLLDSVTSGTQDATFTTLGTNLAKYGSQTVYCRLWWEMNLALILNPGMIGATNFANAWNHAAPIIRTAFNAAAAAGQVLKFSYSYLALMTIGTNNEMTLYPGDTNVDVISPDVYAQIQQTTNPTTAAMLAIVKQRLREAGTYAALHNKPLGLDEWGNHNAGPVDGTNITRGLGDSPQIIDAIYDWAEQNQIDHMSYFSVTGTSGYTPLYSLPNSLAELTVRGNSVATNVVRSR